MSLYFEGYLAFDIIPETPDNIIKTLAYLVRSEDYPFDDFPAHDFFNVEGWRDFLQVRTRPFGEPGLFWSDFHLGYRTIWQGKNIFRYTFSFHRVMHDDVEFYELWRLFLDWIVSYIETKGFVGFYRETYSLHPNIIYVSNGKVFIMEIEGKPKGWNHEETWNGDVQYILPGWLKDKPS